MEIEIIWTSIIIPLIIGPIFVFFKELYDRYNLKKDERILNNYNEKLSRIKEKLKYFYWPIYIKLLFIYQMNFSIPEEKIIDEITSSSSSEDEETTKFTKKKLKRCKGYYQKKNQRRKCKKLVPTNSYEFCKRCIKNIPINNEIEICMPKSTIVDIEINKNNRKDNISITGDGIGKVRNLKMLSTKLDKPTILSLKKIINHNLDEILNIIENYVSSAEPNSKLGKHLVLFIKYSKIKKILDTNEKNYNLEMFGIKDNTNKLLSLIEIKLFDLQKEYKLLIKNGPYFDLDKEESNDSDSNSD